MVGSLAHSAGAVLLAAALALLVAGFASLVWSGLLIANLATSPAIPWSVVVMAGALWLMWRNLGGRWGSRGASERRRALCGPGGRRRRAVVVAQARLTRIVNTPSAWRKRQCA
ncbi:MAG TPA: hypothetical protein VFQ25_04665 [Ktedonobacterales bacterium]|nr:hypothetical protein [Ktedonobacterales bacterium]